MKSLRLIFVIGVLLAFATYGTVVQLADWQNLPGEMLKRSPDAPVLIARLHTQLGLFAGICIGMGLSAGIAAFSQRKQIYDANFAIKAHWAAQALPSLVVIGILNLR